MSVKPTIMENHQLSKILNFIGNENIDYQICCNSISDFNMNTKDTAITLYTQKENPVEKIGVLTYFNMELHASILVPVAKSGAGMVELISALGDENLECCLVNDSIISVRNDPEYNDGIILKFKAKRNAIDLGNMGGRPIAGDDHKFGFVIWLDKFNYESALSELSEVSENA